MNSRYWVSVRGRCGGKHGEQSSVSLCRVVAPDKANSLLNLITRHGHAAERTVMVGDSDNAYRAARSNATHFIGVLPGATTPSPFPGNMLNVPDLFGLEETLDKLM